MPKITAKESKMMNTVRRAFANTTTDITFSQLLQATRLDSVSLTSALVILGAEQENGFWYLPAEKVANVAKPTIDEPTLTNPNTGREYIEMPETGYTIKQAILAQIADSTPAKKFRNRPFTPNPITGYQVQKGKAKIFLDRKATSKTLTLSIDDLRELVTAVEKSERVA